MKQKLKIVIIAALLFAAPLIMFAQPHPNGGNKPGAGNAPVGGSAAIGSGLAILVAMCITYGSRKFYMIRQNEKATTIE